MSDQNQFLLYTAPNGAVKVDVVLKDETVWLTQKALAELFGVRVPGINKHLKNIFDSGELVEDSVISILETTAADGKNYQTRYYNLDAIIAVGYRVNSFQATQFRIWATKTLREFMIIWMNRSEICFLYPRHPRNPRLETGFSASGIWSRRE